MEYKTCKQFSVFLENRVGALSELCKLISDRSINLLAICAIDTIEEAVLRIVSEDETGALKALKEAGLQVIETDIFLVTLDNVPGATGKLATTLAQAGINIDYLYASAHPEGPKSYIVLRTQQMAETEKVLKGGQ
ncbi:MAG: hypothetical protein JRJ02_03075 [Deltaproteobacteria bacterium]|nr:hypothetical protein [Deltaproteobacteria bacterium]MBW1861341.1 hypothetical protein [Deltaproteobacteria bacterium]